MDVDSGNENGDNDPDLKKKSVEVIALGESRDLLIQQQNQKVLAVFLANCRKSRS